MKRLFILLLISLQCFSQEDNCPGLIIELLTSKSSIVSKSKERMFLDANGIDKFLSDYKLPTYDESKVLTESQVQQSNKLAHEQGKMHLGLSEFRTKSGDKHFVKWMNASDMIAAEREAKFTFALSIIEVGPKFHGIKSKSRMN
jgi:hypothetical protein